MPSSIPAILHTYTFFTLGSKEARAGRSYAFDLKTKEPAVLRDQAAKMVEKIRTWNSENLPEMTPKWWNQLN